MGGGAEESVASNSVILDPAASDGDWRGARGCAVGLVSKTTNSSVVDIICIGVKRVVGGGECGRDPGWN